MPWLLFHYAAFVSVDMIEFAAFWFGMILTFSFILFLFLILLFYILGIIGCPRLCIDWKVHYFCLLHWYKNVITNPCLKGIAIIDIFLTYLKFFVMMCTVLVICILYDWLLLLDSIVMPLVHSPLSLQCMAALDPVGIVIGS